jgi:hypothetical protein
VLRKYHELVLVIVIFIVTSLLLKYNWYDKLKNYPEDVESMEKTVSESSNEEQYVK